MQRLAVLLVPLLALSGCFGGDSASIKRSELKEIVLQPEDLGPGFQRFDEGAQQPSEQVRGSRGDPARFGREGGWKARYRRVGSNQTRGPLVVESRADVFGDAGGAKKDLEAQRSELLEGFRLVDRDPGLGDDSFAAAGTQGAGKFAVRVYLVGWRDENATASVLVNGFQGKLTLEQALRLATSQQRRVAAAA